MDNDLYSFDMIQPQLFGIETITSGVLELFPNVWRAVEELAAPDPAIRLRAIVQLDELKAPRLSPLVAYVIATRISDTDLEVRRMVVQILGDLLLSDPDGYRSPEMVRRYVTTTLKQMRTRSLYSLLEVALYHPQMEDHITRLLNVCPHAGRHLVDITADRNFSPEIRRQAVHFIGRVGYLDAIPALEKLEIRLASRLAGQQMMPFALPAAHDEIELIPEIRKNLAILRTP